MTGKELKIVNLHITEDFYQYKGTFRLCSGEDCFEADLSRLSDERYLAEIMEYFELVGTVSDFREEIMKKLVEASGIESRAVEGKECCPEVQDRKTARKIDTLSTS